MKIKPFRAAAIFLLLGALVSLPIASASASTQSAKVKAANTAYAKAIAKARLDLIAAIKPSRDAVIAVGKPAELARREKVKIALAAFNSVVAAEKAPSLAAEKAYKAAILKLAANPKDAALKAKSKAALQTLTQATFALKVDPKITAAREVFAKARALAMTQFKATVASTVKIRNEVQLRELAKFKSVKSKALANLKIALKAAVTKTPSKKKK